ncbi:hypothetical protein ACIHCM_33385 [Streptomyces sp. NPDC052023]|uniref:hypothetical protein n=1 Tax=Streptomyces sp. NPDC052023 TaxID=3365681 RepID=UPI0037D72C6D
MAAVRKYGSALLLLLVGASVLRVSLFNDLYLRYVQAGLRPYLIASGALLALLRLVRGALTARAVREDSADADVHGRQDHGHAHTGAPRVAWLLALPAVALPPGWAFRPYPRAAPAGADDPFQSMRDHGSARSSVPRTCRRAKSSMRDASPCLANTVST